MTDVIFYAEDDGESPAVDWLAEQPDKVQDKFRRLIEMLGQQGNLLRRPHADILRDKIYELRAKQGHVNYRMLYFFHGKEVVVLAHGCTKEDVVDPADIDRALTYRGRFLKDPQSHTYVAEEDDEDEEG